MYFWHAIWYDQSMDKRFVIGGIIVLIFVSANVFLFVLSKQKKPVVTSEGPQLSTSVVTSPPPVSLMAWDDPAGFTFQYPQGLATNKHEEDNESYAHVELTDTNHPGNVIVWVKDAPKGKKGKTVATLTEWIESDTRFNSTSILDTTLGGKPAKKILFQVPQKKIIVGTLFEGFVFMIEGNLLDAEYWTPIHTRIADSFLFTAPRENGVTTAPVTEGNNIQPQASEPVGVAEEAVDEEEVIE